MVQGLRMAVFTGLSRSSRFCTSWICEILCCLAQARWRGYKARSQYKKCRRSAITIQCAWRGRVARNELKKLKHVSAYITVVDIVCKRMLCWSYCLFLVCSNSGFQFIVVQLVILLHIMYSSGLTESGWFSS